MPPKGPTRCALIHNNDMAIIDNSRQHEKHWSRVVHDFFTSEYRLDRWYQRNTK